MSGRIPQSFIDELIARADIVEIIGSRVALKKAGREYKACCPFHNEKTASLWVSPAKQFYPCFGCGAHGNGLAPLSELLGRVAEFYATTLEGSTRARDYAAARGLEPDTIERFQIGYAPDAWDELMKRFGGSVEPRRQLAVTGLIIERTSGSEGFYDRFRDRLMFPIRDTRGRVIAFGGRILDQGEPKYSNLPEDALFPQGRGIYGLYESRGARQGLKRARVGR